MIHNMLNCKLSIGNNVENSLIIIKTKTVVYLGKTTELLDLLKKNK